MSMRRAALVVVLLCASAEAGWNHVKRHKSSSGSSAGDMLANLAELLHIRTPPFVYNSDRDGSRQEMIDALWAGTWTETVADRFSTANPALQQLLEQQMVDDADDPSRFRALQGQSRWEAVLSALFRARSQKWVPIETAAMSVMWLYYRVPKPVWQAVSYFGRSVMSRAWVESLCDDAIERDPGPSYPVAEGLTAAVFDNLMMNVGYSGFATSDSDGRKIEMTNWATVFLPAAAMPPTFTGIYGESARCGWNLSERSQHGRFYRRLQPASTRHPQQPALPMEALLGFGDEWQCVGRGAFRFTVPTDKVPLSQSDLRQAAELIC